MAKAMVTQHGKSVAKNYHPDDLRAKTLGLQIRIDRGKIREMTPAQQAEALAVFEQMAVELRQQLGQESVGFEPGTVVKVTGAHIPDMDDYGLLALVTNDTESVLRLQYLNDNYTMVRMTTNYSVAVVSEVVLKDPDTHERFTGLPGLVLAMAENSARRLSWEQMENSFPELIEDTSFLRQFVFHLTAQSRSVRGRFLKAIGDDEWILRQITEGHFLREDDLLSISDSNLLVEYMDNCDGWRNCDQTFRVATLSVLLKHPGLLTEVFPKSRGDLAYCLEDLRNEGSETRKASLLIAIKHGCHQDQVDAIGYIAKSGLVDMKELTGLASELVQTSQSAKEILEYWETLRRYIYPMYRQNKDGLLDVFRSSLKKMSGLRASNATMQDLVDHMVSDLLAADRETLLEAANNHMSPGRRLFWDDNQGTVEIGSTRNEVPGP